jgi:hypothetical protein
MFELFTAMVKEEWRIHSTIFGSLSFALFPVMIFGIAFMGSFLLPLFRTVLPAGSLAIILHALFVLLGIMVGGFGLVGMEAMNRRFGQASLLAYSARSLPLSETMIFANFVVKDTVYYFILWVFPFVAGFFLASPFIGIGLYLPFLLLLTLTLAFLTGLSAVFFLSTVYSRSKALFALIFALVLIPWGAISLYTNVNAVVLFPPLLLFNSFSWMTLLATGLLIAVPFCISIILFSSEYTDTTKRYKNILTPLTRKLSFFPYPSLAAKDLVDLRRSGAGIGQTIFSFFIPLGLLWVLLSVLAPFLPAGGLYILFAILTGVISSTMYTWITAFDTFGAYACLPVSVSTLLTSKISTFAVMQLVPVVLIAFVTTATGAVAWLLPSIVLCLAVSFYTLAVTVWLTGLSPSVLVYDAKVLVRYLLVVGIVLIVLIILSFLNPYYAFTSVLLGIPAWYLLRRGYRIWEARDQTGF